MTTPTLSPEELRRFRQLMQDGKHAYDRGKKQVAHDLWRQAAMLDPYHEGVWLALLKVLDQRNDRQVCLKNILEINPNNVQARQMLRKLQQPPRRKKAPVKRASPLSLISRGLLSLVLFVLAGLCIGASLSLLVSGV